MKNILNKIEFHYTYIIMAFGLVITGHFVNLIIFTSLIIIHEMGHIIISKILSYKIDKVIIYPYGGFVKLNTRINTKIENDLQMPLEIYTFKSYHDFILFILYRAAALNIQFNKCKNNIIAHPGFDQDRL